MLAVALCLAVQLPYAVVESVGDEKMLFLVPLNYDAQKGAPLIVYHHGVGENERALLADALKTDCVNALSQAGYILCGSNADGNNWGSQRALDAYADLYRHAKANYRITRVCFWSQSMGGVSGLLALRDPRIPNVRGWLGTYPVANLKAMYNAARFAPQIEAAYRFQGKDKWAATLGHDPAALSGPSFKTPRLRFYASPEDTIVTKKDNTDVMFSLLNVQRKECEVVTCKGDHGDRSHFDPKGYVAFFDRCR